MAGNDEDMGNEGWGRSHSVAMQAAGDGTSPVPGVDWPTFKNFVTRALNGDETVPASVLNRVNAAIRSDETDLEKRDRRWWQDFFWREMVAENLRAIDVLIDKYNRMADWHHVQAEEARARMQEAADKLEEIDAFLGDVDSVFDEGSQKGHIDRDRALQLLKARGVVVDPDANDETVMMMLIEERKRARAEKLSWSARYEVAGTDHDYHDRQERESRRKAQELVERRDAIRNGGYDLEEESRRLQQIAEEYEADIRRKAYEIEHGKKGANESSKDLLNTAQKDIDDAQASQTKSEAAEFEALAGSLKEAFTSVASNVVEPKSPPPVPKAPTPSGHAFSV